MPSQFTVASPGASLTTATAANITSTTLPAGTYLVWGQVNIAATGATITEARAGVSLSSGTLPAQAGGSGLGPEALSVLTTALTLVTDTLCVLSCPTILKLAVSTTLFLVAQATFSAGTCTAYGTLNALPIVGTGLNLAAS